MKNVVATAVVWVASVPFAAESWLFVPINILFACSVGTACAFAWSDKPIEPRKRMWAMLVTCIAMGAAFTAVCNWAVAIAWNVTITDGAQAGMGAVVSFVTKSFLPWVRDFVAEGKWTDYLPWKKKDN